MELDDAIRARHIVDEEMQIAFAQSNLAGRAKTWALGLKLHDPYVFGSLEVFKSLLRQTFEPPRAEFRARSKLLRIKQGTLVNSVHTSPYQLHNSRPTEPTNVDYVVHAGSD